MIIFKAIELSDKPLIDECLANNTFRACDYCFTNLFTWQSKFKTSFAVADKTLFISYNDINDGLCYMMPIGQMPLNNAMQLMINDSKEKNIPFIMKGITERMWTCIDSVMPNVFKYSEDRDNAEYIYTSEKLIGLAGRKLQPKRNHINNFKSSYSDWQYSALTTQDELKECSLMLDKWEDLNVAKAQDSLRFDYIATKTMLDNFSAMCLHGGLIRVNGEIVAFTIGEQLTSDTFVIHVEKALTQIRGAYTMINQQFAANAAAQYKYINREEDMGMEYLRQAKMSYSPDILLHERVLTLVEPKGDSVQF